MPGGHRRSERQRRRRGCRHDNSSGRRGGSTRLSAARREREDGVSDAGASKPSRGCVARRYVRSSGSGSVVRWSPPPNSGSGMRPDEASLVRWGERIGQTVDTPIFLGLRGPLGAGKSVLARAIGLPMAQQFTRPGGESEGNVFVLVQLQAFQPPTQDRYPTPLRFRRRKTRCRGRRWDRAWLPWRTCPCQTRSNTARR